MIHIDGDTIRIDDFVALLMVMDNCIEIQEKHYLVKIKGNGLRIVSLSGDEIVCDGKISEAIFI